MTRELKRELAAAEERGDKEAQRRALRALVESSARAGSSEQASRYAARWSSIALEEDEHADAAAAEFCRAQALARLSQRGAAEEAYGRCIQYAKQYTETGTFDPETYEIQARAHLFRARALAGQGGASAIVRRAREEGKHALSAARRSGNAELVERVEAAVEEMSRLAPSAETIDLTAADGGGSLAPRAGADAEACPRARKPGAARAHGSIAARGIRGPVVVRGGAAAAGTTRRHAEAPRAPGPHAGAGRQAESRRARAVHPYFASHGSAVRTSAEHGAARAGAVGGPSAPPQPPLPSSLAAWASLRAADAPLALPSAGSAAVPAAGQAAAPHEGGSGRPLEDCTLRASNLGGAHGAPPAHAATAASVAGEGRAPSARTSHAAPAGAQSAAAAGASAAAADDDEDLDEDMTCTVCQDLMYRPISLPCGHTFCKGCLLKWQAVKGTCPTCRQALPSLVSADGTAATTGAAVNTALWSLIQRKYPARVASMRAQSEAALQQEEAAAAAAARRQRLMADMTARRALAARADYLALVKQALEAGCWRMCRCAPPMVTVPRTLRRPGDRHDGRVYFACPRPQESSCGFFEYEY